MPARFTHAFYPGHLVDLIVFYVTTILCALSALMLPLAG